MYLLILIRRRHSSFNANTRSFNSFSQYFRLHSQLLRSGQSIWSWAWIWYDCAKWGMNISIWVRDVTKNTHVTRNFDSLQPFVRLDCKCTLWKIQERLVWNIWRCVLWSRLQSPIIGDQQAHGRDDSLWRYYLPDDSRSFWSPGTPAQPDYSHQFRSPGRRGACQTRQPGATDRNWLRILDWGTFPDTKQSPIPWSEKIQNCRKLLFIGFDWHSNFFKGLKYRKILSGQR